DRVSFGRFVATNCRSERNSRACTFVFSLRFRPAFRRHSCNPLEDDMAYDRYETRDAPRDERSRWRDDRSDGRGRGGRDDRGFFERAGDEVASWFGDEDAERRRREDQMREGGERGYGRQSRDFDRGEDRE